MSTVLDPVKREADKDRARIHHIYMPYALTDLIPPPGAVALCGVVRRGTSTDFILGLDHPDVCVVCASLVR